MNQTIQTVCREAHWQARPLATGEFTATTVPYKALPMKAGRKPFYLRSTITFEFIDDAEHRGERKVKTLSYAHTVAADADLEEELYSWQWHPAGWLYPHVHVGKNRLHIPTGRVFLEQVVDFVVRELHVEPQRDDWAEILRGNLDRVSKHATWGAIGLTRQAN